MLTTGQHRYGVVVGALVGFVACGEPQEELPRELYDLPAISWKGEYVEFGTDVETNVCPQTLPFMDEYMGSVDEHVRSGTTYPIRYFYLSGDLTSHGFGCPEGSYGCVDRDAESLVVGSKQLSLKHELIHASSLGWQHRLLEEGLAVFLGTDLQWWGIAEPLDIRAAFESVDGNEGVLPAEFYPVAGHFVSYLADMHGLPNVVSLVEASAAGMTLPELAELSVEHLGQDLRLELDAYEGAGPGCEVAQFSPMWLECELTPPSIPMFTCGADQGYISIDVSVACDDEASGVQDGLIWRDILIDVEEPVLGLIWLHEGDPVEFVVRGCGQGCDTPFARVTTSEANSEGLIQHGLDLRVGLNLVRIIKPIEAEGRVRFSIGGVCP